MSPYHMSTIIRVFIQMAMILFNFEIYLYMAQAYVMMDLVLDAKWEGPPKNQPSEYPGIV